MEAEVDIPLINMLTLINEVELWNIWVPFIKRIMERKVLHKGAKVYYLEFGLPYPLANRDMYVNGGGINRLFENGTILVIAKSIDNDQEFFRKHEISRVDNPSSVNIEISLGGFEITPLGPEKIRFRGVANANPNFGWLPEKVLNFVIRKGADLMLNKMVNTAKGFKGSVWEKETMKEEKRELYDWIKGEVQKYFAQEAEKKEHNIQP